MRRLYILIICLVSSLALSAQITISNSVFPNVGDTLFTRVDVTPMINFIPLEGRQEWTFDGLSSPALVETYFQDASEGISNYFPQAGMVNIVENGPEFYYRSNDTSFAELGYYAMDPLTGSLMINAYYTKPLVLRYAPLSYGDIHQQNTELLVPISTEVIPDTILNSLPIQPDSLRLRIQINRQDTVTAYGTLTLNQSSFEVLQEKRVEKRTVYFDALVSFFGWQDITEYVEGQFPQFGAGSSDTLVTYYYFSEGVKEAIAVVSVDDMDTPQRVEFKNVQRSTSARAYRIEDIQLSASPNPGVGIVEFRISNAPASRYRIKVRNIMGQTLWEKEIFVQGKENLNVDLTHLKRGTYFYSLIDEDGNSIMTKRLVFIRA